MLLPPFVQTFGRPEIFPAPVGSEITLRPYKRARMVDQGDNAVGQGLDRHRLGKEVIDARIPRHRHPLGFGVAGQHDNGHIT